MTHFEEFGYEIVQNAISKELTQLLTAEFNIVRDNVFLDNTEPLDGVGLCNDNQVEKSFAYYALPGFEALLEMVRPLVENVTGKNLYPTYSYARIYYHGAVMDKHKDRPSCQYSATLTLDIDETSWPIWFTDAQNITKPLTLNVGDMCIYTGDKLDHWREEYTGKKQIQVFLHYVDADGEYSLFRFDNRPMLGHKIKKEAKKFSNGNLEEITPFTTSIYKTVLNDCSFFAWHAKSLTEKDNSNIISNRGGWQSPSFVYGEDIVFVPLVNTIIDYLKILYQNYGINKEPELANYWININKKYDYNIAHTHSHSYFSAVLYLKVPTDSGNIVFERPDDLHSYIASDFTTDKNNGSYYLIPSNNLLIIFPSHLSHRVEQNLSNDADDERISIAFNFR